MTVFSKRQYETLAGVVEEFDRIEAKATSPMSTRDLVGLLVKTFKADNPRFDVDKFVEACHLGYDVNAGPLGEDNPLAVGY